ncbi:hypothetical protein [Moorena sp. SIOASIH]
MAAKPKLVIEAGRTEKQYWKDLWGYRELFYLLPWRALFDNGSVYGGVW